MKTVHVSFDVPIPDDMTIEQAEEWIAFNTGNRWDMLPTHSQMNKDINPVTSLFSVTGR